LIPRKFFSKNNHSRAEKYALDYWGKFNIDKTFQTAPIIEYALISLESLSNLLRNSLTVSVSFVESEDFINMTPGRIGGRKMFRKESDLEEYCDERRLLGKFRVHLFWELKLQCKNNGH
jgi:hypothetical protein